MDIQDYKNNSHKYKAEQELKKKEDETKKVGKVINGTARIKTNKARNLLNTFVVEDLDAVKSHVRDDVVIPTIKNLIIDTISMLLLGGTRRDRNGSRASKASYASYYDRRDDRASVQPSYSRRFNYNDIVFDTRHDAVAALDKMHEMIDEYGQVTINDLYDMVEITGNYNDCKYGWTNIDGSRVEPTRDGWVLVLPKARPLTR